MNYLTLFAKVLRDPSLANPTLKIQDISALNPSKLKSAGIDYIVFDKDNTLTLTYKKDYFNHQIAHSIKEF